MSIDLQEILDITFVDIKNNRFVETIHMLENDFKRRFRRNVSLRFANSKIYMVARVSRVNEIVTVSMVPVVNRSKKMKRGEYIETADFLTIKTDGEVTCRIPLGYRKEVRP